MYVCLCKAITDRDIRRAAANGADTLYELQQSLGVATGCGSCADHARTILEDAQARGGRATPAMYIPA